MSTIVAAKTTRMIHAGNLGQFITLATSTDFIHVVSSWDSKCILIRSSKILLILIAVRYSCSSRLVYDLHYISLWLVEAFNYTTYLEDGFAYKWV